MYRVRESSPSQQEVDDKVTRYRIFRDDRQGINKTIEQLQQEVEEYEEVLKEAKKYGIPFRHPEGTYNNISILRDKLDDYKATRKLAEEYKIPTTFHNGAIVPYRTLQNTIYRYELKFDEEEYIPKSCSKYAFEGPDGNKTASVYILDQSALNLLVVHEKVIPVNLRRIGVPKGRVKISETTENAFYRETCEEVGIDLSEIPHTILKQTNKHLVIMIREDWEDIPFYRGREILKIEWLNLEWLINDMKKNPKTYNYALREHIGMLRQILRTATQYNKF